MCIGTLAYKVFQNTYKDTLRGPRTSSGYDLGGRGDRHFFPKDPRRCHHLEPFQEDEVSQSMGQDQNRFGSSDEEHIDN